MRKKNYWNQILIGHNKINTKWKVPLVFSPNPLLSLRAHFYTQFLRPNIFFFGAIMWIRIEEKIIHAHYTIVIYCWITRVTERNYSNLWYLMYRNIMHILKIGQKFWLKMKIGANLVELTFFWYIFVSKK